MSSKCSLLCAQGSLMMELKAPYGMPGIETTLAVCKVSTFSSVLSLGSHSQCSPTLLSVGPMVLMEPLWGTPTYSPNAWMLQPLMPVSCLASPTTHTKSSGKPLTLEPHCSFSSRHEAPLTCPHCPLKHLCRTHLSVLCNFQYSAHHWQSSGKAAAFHCWPCS